jgi:hypothetical protein
MPDGTMQKGISEAALSHEKEEMVQFERVGFVRLDKNDKNGVRAIFAHR